jgi:Putative Actinobacterial Holin-X, holin superfamily III
MGVVSMAEPRTDASTAELIKRATEQISTLVRDEMALARTEMVAKARHAGVGAGLFGGAGVVALYGVAGVLGAIVLLLARVMPAWAAALLVGFALLAVAGLMAVVGRGQVRQAVPPMPTEAIRDLRADIGAVSTAVEERRPPARGGVPERAAVPGSAGGGA